MNQYNDIEESSDILIMRKVYKPEDLKLQPGHLRLGFDLLVSTLFVTYEHTKFSELVNNATVNPNKTSEIFSRNIEKVCKVKEWNKGTISIAFMALKRIMNETSISPIFVQTLSIIITPKIDRNSDEYCLPSTYKKYDNDHHGKQLLLQWIKECKTTTRNKSQSIVRQIISFALQACSALDISVDKFDFEKASSLTFDQLKGAVENIPGKIKTETRIRYATVFAKTFLKTDNISYEQMNAWLKSAPKTSRPQTTDVDVHRLTNQEMEAIYNASKENVRNELIILLLSTTGIRVGGLSNILVANVCKTVGKNIIINENGRTKEKGGKWFSFVIAPNVKQVLHAWLAYHRKNHSEYVFPGRGENPLCTSYIARIIKDIGRKAGVEGPHVHPHSIRHTFAHMLLEAGNDPGLVAKMMGHASSKTTEMYYLKESAVEASKRCNIPWLVKDNKQEPLPQFLVAKKKPKLSKIEKNKNLKMLATEFAKPAIVSS